MSGEAQPNPNARPPADGPAAGRMGRVDGPQIDLGMGRRPVTGNDLFLLRALVSNNAQTIEDLSALRGDEQAALARYAGQTRPAFVTEGLVDRVSDRLTRWVCGGARRVRYWVFRHRTGPTAVRVKGAWRDARDALRKEPPPAAGPRPTDRPTKRAA